LTKKDNFTGVGEFKIKKKYRKIIKKEIRIKKKWGASCDNEYTQKKIIWKK